jgi:hypothetical protein
VTVPLPEPDAPAVSDSQEALSVAVHEQPPRAVTSMVLLEAAGPSEARVGEMP